MSEPDDREGFREGLQSSKGDPRVALLLNAVLSLLFAWTAVAGLDLIGVVELTLGNVVTGAVVVFALTYVVAGR